MSIVEGLRFRVQSPGCSTHPPSAGAPWLCRSLSTWTADPWRHPTSPPPFPSYWRSSRVFGGGLCVSATTLSEDALDTRTGSPSVSCTSRTRTRNARLLSLPLPSTLLAPVRCTSPLCLAERNQGKAYSLEFLSSGSLPFWRWRVAPPGLPRTSTKSVDFGIAVCAHSTTADRHTRGHADG